MALGSFINAFIIVVRVGGNQHSYRVLCHNGVPNYQYRITQIAAFTITEHAYKYCLCSYIIPTEITIVLIYVAYSQLSYSKL